MSYELDFERPALRNLEQVGRVASSRIVAGLERLAADAEQYPHEAMSGAWRGHFRMRVGNYRAIYRLDHDARRVLVIAAGHRSDVYRD